jgi:hypothetical protein
MQIWRIENSAWGWSAYFIAGALIVLAVIDSPVDLPLVHSEFFFSNTTEFIPYVAQLVTNTNIIVLGYGNFTLVTTGSVSAGHLIFVYVSMYIPVNSGNFNGSNIEQIRIFPERSFMYNSTSSNHQSLETGFIDLFPAKNGTIQRLFSGNADLQWSEGGNFNATFTARSTSVGPLDSRMAYGV